MQYLALVSLGERLEFTSKLNIESHPSVARHTSIGATIGKYFILFIHFNGFRINMILHITQCLSAMFKFKSKSKYSLGSSPIIVHNLQLHLKVEIFNKLIVQFFSTNLFSF